MTFNLRDDRRNYGERQGFRATARPTSDHGGLGTAWRGSPRDSMRKCKPRKSAVRSAAGLKRTMRRNGLNNSVVAPNSLEAKLVRPAQSTHHAPARTTAKNIDAKVHIICLLDNGTRSFSRRSGSRQISDGSTTGFLKLCDWRLRRRLRLNLAGAPV